MTSFLSLHLKLFFSRSCFEFSPCEKEGNRGVILTPRGGNRDSCDYIIAFLWHPLSADKLLLNLVAGQRPAVSGAEMGTDHIGSQVQQTEWLHLWSHTSGCGRGGEGQEGPWAPCPSPKPSNAAPPSTSGSTGLCRRHWKKCLQKAPTCWNSHETDPKMGQRGFLPAERERQRLTAGEGKPTGDGAKERWWGNPGWLTQAESPSSDGSVGMSPCNSWAGAEEGSPASSVVSSRRCSPQCLKESFLLTCHILLTLQHWWGSGEEVNLGTGTRASRDFQDQLIQCPHFQDGDQGPEKVRNLPKLTQQVRAVLGQ